jgi:hypothetical protein
MSNEGAQCGDWSLIPLVASQAMSVRRNIRIGQVVTRKLSRLATSIRNPKCVCRKLTKEASVVGGKARVAKKQMLLHLRQQRSLKTDEADSSVN